MNGNTQTSDEQALSGHERDSFLRHMSCRLFLGLWALKSALMDPFDKLIITLILLSCTLGIVNTIFISLQGWARYRDEQEQKRLLLEAVESHKREKALRLKIAQNESAEKYFDLGPDKA